MTTIGVIVLCAVVVVAYVGIVLIKSAFGDDED